MSNQRLAALAAAGVSIWLDDLSRERLTSGNLAQLITEDSVVGVTTNPTIFAGALSDGQAYDAQVRELAERGAEGLSMRAVATRAGVAPNALYSHVENRAALVDALLDDLLAAVPAPSPDAEPAAGLRTVMLLSLIHI